MDPSLARTKAECQGVIWSLPFCGIKAIDSFLISVDGWIESLRCSGNALAIASAKAFDLGQEHITHTSALLLTFPRTIIHLAISLQNRLVCSVVIFLVFI